MTAPVTPPARPHNVTKTRGGGESKNNVEASKDKGEAAAVNPLEPLMFPDDDDDDDDRAQFFNEVLSAVQRWYCCSGWPDAINLVTVPHSFRRYHRHHCHHLDLLPWRHAAVAPSVSVSRLLGLLQSLWLPASSC